MAFTPPRPRWPRLATIGIMTSALGAALIVGCDPGDQSFSTSPQPTLKGAPATFAIATTTSLFQESFEDDALASRGWYDNTNLTITTEPGSTGELEMHYLPGSRRPTFGGSARRVFTPTSTLYVSYWVKYSDNWIGSGKAYAPQEFVVLSDMDGDYDGPGSNWLALYLDNIYQEGGIPRVAIQDSKAINTSLGGPPLDLNGITEDRSTAGCNGVAESNIQTTCYNASGWYNEKVVRGAQVAFQPNPGEGYKGNWNHVEAYFQMNSVVGGVALADGIVQYWFNGVLVIDRHDIVLRAGARPTMQFHQFMIVPYIGGGSPVDQSARFDEVSVATAPPGVSPPSTSVAVGSTSRLTADGPASSSPSAAWPNEPAGFRVISDYDFSNLPGGGWQTNGGAADAYDASAPVSPPAVGQWFYGQGMTAGVSPGTVWSNPAPFADHYVGYYFKYGNPYSNHPVGTKQWYPYNGTADFFVLFNSYSKIQVDVQVPPEYGGSYNLYGNVNDPTITLGEWHRVELYFKRASNSWANDGIIRWWIDGTLCGDYANIPWPEMRFEEMRLTPTWGGVGGNVEFDSYWWLDHIHVSHP